MCGCEDPESVDFSDLVRDSACGLMSELRDILGTFEGCKDGAEKDEDVRPASMRVNKRVHQIEHILKRCTDSYVLAANFGRAG